MYIYMVIILLFLFDGVKFAPCTSFLQMHENTIKRKWNVFSIRA